MSDLSGLLKRLGIEIFSKDDVEINGGLYLRGQIQAAATSFSAAQQLGYRVILQLMDEYEEPKAAEKDQNRCAVCGWPLKKSADGGCIRGNCSQRPLYEGEWYDPDRAVREGYPFETAKAHGAHKQESKLTREPGTPCVERGCEPGHHKFETGDWAQHEKRDNPFQVASVDGQMLEDDGEWFNAIWCRHVPAPRKDAQQKKKENPDYCDNDEVAKARDHEADEAEIANETSRQLFGHGTTDPFTGPHWDTSRRELPIQEIVDSLDRRTIDLRDEIRRLKEKK